MGRAQENLDDDQGDEAGKQEEEALADLEDAQEELEETRREAEEQLAMEQLERMGDKLKSLAERQQKIVSETSSYEAMRQKNDGKLTIAQRAGSQGAGSGADRHQGRDGRPDRKPQGAPVFALTLRRASKNMEETAQRLGELKTDTATEQAARAASDSIQATHGITQGRRGQRSRRSVGAVGAAAVAAVGKRGQRRRHSRGRTAQDAQVAPARDQRTDRSP